jgi:hypothetical protein
MEQAIETAFSRVNSAEAIGESLYCHPGMFLSEQPISPLTLLLLFYAANAALTTSDSIRCRVFLEYAGHSPPRPMPALGEAAFALMTLTVASRHNPVVVVDCFVIWTIPVNEKRRLVAAHQLVRDARATRTVVAVICSAHQMDAARESTVQLVIHRPQGSPGCFEGKPANKQTWHVDKTRELFNQ